MPCDPDWYRVALLKRKRVLLFLLVLAVSVGFMTLSTPAFAQEGDSGVSSDPNALDNPPDPDPPGPAALEVSDWFSSTCGSCICPDSGCDGGGSSLMDQTVVDRYAIVAYARQYVGNTVGDVMSSVGYHPAFRAFKNDCQNFVSQALLYGGWPMDQTGNWFYNSHTDISFGWANVAHFRSYASSSGRGSYKKYWYQLGLGDVIMVDWNGKSTPPDRNHSMVVTGIVRDAYGRMSDLMLTYHTSNRLDKSLRALRQDNPNATWWAFHLKGSF